MIFKAKTYWTKSQEECRIERKETCRVNFRFCNANAQRRGLVKLRTGHRQCSLSAVPIDRHNGRTVCIRYNCEAAVRQWRQPTFKQLTDSDMCCGAEGGLEPELLAAMAWSNGGLRDTILWW